MLDPPSFHFLDQQTQLHGETLPGEVLAGQRVPLIGPQGIKAECLRERRLPLDSGRTGFLV
jgi:hypothetical protein